MYTVNPRRLWCDDIRVHLNYCGRPSVSGCTNIRPSCTVKYACSSWHWWRHRRKRWGNVHHNSFFITRASLITVNYISRGRGSNREMYTTTPQGDDTASKLLSYSGGWMSGWMQWNTNNVPAVYSIGGHIEGNDEEMYTANSFSWCYNVGNPIVKGIVVGKMSPDVWP